jgi:ubiquinone/menaquinone biosynthesis C-methylase UbiE
MSHERPWKIEWPTESTPVPSRAIIDDAAYVGTIPQHYHRGIGPFLAEPFAWHTAERIGTRAPKVVLETACGTGIVTRRLRDALPRDALLVASDLNEPMLAVARHAVGASADVAWARANMCDLQFGDAGFDTVVCQFGLMYVPDKLAAVREARRVLKLGGRFLVTTWAPLDRNPIIGLAHRTLGAVFPGDPPQYLARAPFGHGDPDALADLLVTGGFRDVVVDVVEKAAVSRSARELAVGLIKGYPMVDEIKLRGEARLPEAVVAVAKAIGRQFGEAPVKARITALVASAVA